ncbi:MAG: hypothetical protein VYA69_13095 [Gemmatimonadota bacterium]|nr:hypothetical protein [Gemmatimonadota bacterium]
MFYLVCLRLVGIPSSRFADRAARSYDGRKRQRKHTDMGGDDCFRNQADVAVAAATEQTGRKGLTDWKDGSPECIV